jgi:hypothetical protein
VTAVVVLTEVRRRLDVSSTHLSDDILAHWINTATEAVDAYVPSYNRSAYGYTEAVIQLACKIADTSARGTISVDPAGEYVSPAPAATAGLIKSVWGLIGPLTEPGFA